MQRTRTYETWRKERPQNEAWAKRVNDAMPAYERRRPRDPDEARLLLSCGTPCNLVGSVDDSLRFRR
jgi:hypothetical protein